VNYDNSLVVTITLTCYLWAPSSGDHLFTCGAIARPLQATLYKCCRKYDALKKKTKQNETVQIIHCIVSELVEKQQTEPTQSCIQIIRA